MPAEWFIYGLKEDDSEDLLVICNYWIPDVVNWMSEDWSVLGHQYVGLKIMASEEMKKLLKGEEIDQV